MNCQSYIAQEVFDSYEVFKPEESFFFYILSNYMDIYLFQITCSPAYPTEPQLATILGQASLSILIDRARLVGVTYQPLHFAPSIKYLSCLISISFRRSSASFPVFMCRVQFTPSIDWFCSEHQTQLLFIHALEPLGSDIHVL